MKNLTPEIIEKAKAAASADELIAIAKENGLEITSEEAKTFFEQLNANGAVADEELDLVAGGCGGEDTYEEGEMVDFKTPCPDCKCILAFYSKADSQGGCFVRCAQCNKLYWFNNTHDGIEKHERPTWF